MSSKGWFNLETAAGTIPETQFFEGDSAFSSLGLTRTQRLYGFAGWYVLVTRFLVGDFGLITFVIFGCSYAIGLILSALGTVMLFIGSLASFAGTSSKSLRRSVLVLIVPCGF